MRPNNTASYFHTPVDLEVERDPSSVGRKKQAQDANDPLFRRLPLEVEADDRDFCYKRWLLFFLFVVLCAYCVVSPVVRSKSHGPAFGTSTSTSAICFQFSILRLSYAAVWNTVAIAARAETSKSREELLRKKTWTSHISSRKTMQIQEQLDYRTMPCTGHA